jgi:hypothetical protein
MECDPGFSRLLSDFHEVALESHHGVIFGIWAEGRLAYVNPAWRQFALENDGEQLLRNYVMGSVIFSAMSRQLETFYRGAIRRCLNSQDPWRHEYECSGPDTFRQCQLMAYPLKQEGLLIVNSLLVEHPLNHHAFISDAELLRQCWLCGRYARPGEERRWDMIRDWANTKPKVSHGLCMICLCYHFPEIAASIADDVLGDLDNS